MGHKIDDYRRIVHYDGKLIRQILIWQRSLRLLKLIPSWEAFSPTEPCKEMIAALDIRAMSKVVAWWNLLLDIQRGEDDKASVKYAVLCAIYERSRRSYGKIPLFDFKKLGLPDDHAAKILDCVKSKFEKLCPL